MFQRKTIFVIGAGASFEVGIPVGVELAKTISQLMSLEHDKPIDHPIHRILENVYERWPATSDVYYPAAVAISRGARLANSIDDYLDQHSASEPIQRVGKAAIVRTILAAEQTSRFRYDFANAPNKLINIDDVEARGS